MYNKSKFNIFNIMKAKKIPAKGKKLASTKPVAISKKVSAPLSTKSRLKND